MDGIMDSKCLSMEAEIGLFLKFLSQFIAGTVGKWGPLSFPHENPHEPAAYLFECTFIVETLIPMVC